MKSHKRFKVLVAVAILAASCSTAEDGVSRVTTIDPVQVSEAPGSTDKPDNTDPEVEVVMPDLSTGYKLADLGEDLSLWALPDPQTTGCEGNSGWRVWSVSTGGDDPFLASGTLFAAAPSVQHPSGGILLTTNCEEQSWQIIYSAVDLDGTFLNETSVRAPGHEELSIQDVMFDPARDDLIFTLNDGEATRLVAFNPSTGVVNDDFILGSAEQGCSAQGMTITLPTEPDMSTAARRTRDQIAAAASACHFDVLEQIGGDTLRFSFDGGQHGAARYWALSEYFGGNDLQEMLNLLTLDSANNVIGDATDAYAWPKASILPVTAFDESVRQQLIDLGLGNQEIEETMNTGMYYGYRIAIDVDGNWLWFVAGD